MDLQHLYKKMKSHEVTTTKVSTNPVIDFVINELKRQCKLAEEGNRTGNMWVRCIEIAKKLHASTYVLNGLVTGHCTAYAYAKRYPYPALQLGYFRQSRI